MGISGEIGEHLRGAGERPLRKDDPFRRPQGSKVVFEQRPIGEVGKVAKELQLPGGMQLRKSRQKQSSEQA